MAFLEDIHRSPAELFHELAVSVADAQLALDEKSFEIAEMMAGVLRPDVEEVPPEESDPATWINTRVHFGFEIKEIEAGEEGEGTEMQIIPQKLSLMELGFIPQFYGLVETDLSMRVACRLIKDANKADGQRHLTLKTVDASYDRTYSFPVSYSSKIAFKVRPVPPPVTSENIIEEASDI